MFIENITRAILTFIWLSLHIQTIAQQTVDTTKSSQLEGVTIFGNSLKKMTGSAQYINNKLLEKINESNINNALRIAPGINIRDEEGFGLRPNIGLRGTPVNRSAKITIMEDGVLIAPAPYSDPSAYYFPTFSRMHGIEVLKGSSQIKYGPFTIGGALNLISTPISDTFLGFAQLSIGSFLTNHQKIGVSDSHESIDYVFLVNRIASDGFKELDNGQKTGFDRRDFMGKVRWHSNPKAKVKQSLMLKFVSAAEKGNETYLGLTYNDFIKNPLRRYAGTQKDFLDMSHNHISLHHNLSPNKRISINTILYQTNTYRDWARASAFGGQSINNILKDPDLYRSAYEIMIGKTNGEISYQSAPRSYQSRGVQTSAGFVFNTSYVKHNIQIGLRFHTDQSDRFSTLSSYSMTNGNMIQTSSGLKGNQENQIRKANGFSAYISHELDYKGIKINPGIRFEKVGFNLYDYGTADNARLGTSLRTAKNDLTVFLPGIGLHHKWNKNMSLFASVHKGFSPPGMPSLSSVFSQANIEKSTNYELGYQFEKGLLHVQLTGFLNQYGNILGSDNLSGGGAGTGDVFNAGKALIQGIEFEMAFDLLHLKNETTSFHIPIQIAYTYSSARFKETFVNGGGDWGSGLIQRNDLIPFITPHLLTAMVGLEHKKWNVNITGRYTGVTRTKPGQNQINLPHVNEKYADINAISAYLIVDLSANYTVNHFLSFFTTINNITNNGTIVSNLPQGYRPNMPISLNIGLKLYF
ncbi:MAG: Iron(III) dicitrate transport protein FecA [Bacteroidota bacterium]